MKIHFNRLLKLYLNGLATQQENNEFFEMVVIGDYENEIIKSLEYDIEFEKLSFFARFKNSSESKLLGFLVKIFKLNNRWMVIDFLNFRRFTQYKYYNSKSLNNLTTKTPKTINFIEN